MRTISKATQMFAVIVILAMAFTGCGGSLPNTDPPDNGDPGDTTTPTAKSILLGVFNSDAADQPERSGTIMATVPTTLELFDWSPDVPGDQWVIRPDEIRIAFRYIALVTKTAYDQTDTNGLIGDDRIPTANRASLAAGAFVLLDRTGADDQPMIFNLNDTSYPISTDEFPEIDVDYGALASEPVFYEAIIDGYGTIRAVLSDYTFGDGTVAYAGDVLAFLEGESAWQWVYVQAGNGFDGGSMPPWLTLTAGSAYSDETATDGDGNGIADGDTGWYGPIDSDADGTADEPVFFAGTINDPAPYTELYDTFGYISGSDPVTINFGTLTNSSAFRFWVAGMDSFEPISNLMAPQFDYDTDPAGYNTDGTIAGSGGGVTSDPEAYFRTVYYEPDLHAGTEDLARVIYSSTRLVDSANFMDRDAATIEYGNYLWDSGLYLQPYTSNSSIPNTMNQIFLNRNGSPDGTWRFSDDAAQVIFELSLGSAIQFGKDRGSDIEDFGERFITDVPLWITDDTLYPNIPGNAPLASPYAGTPLDPVTQHYGFRQNTEAGVSTTCNIDFGFIMGDINVLTETVSASQLTAYPPTMLPEAGIFDPIEGNLVVTLTASDENSIVYYTTDGTDPEISSDGTALGTTESSGTFEATLDIGITTTTVKALCTNASGTSVSEIVAGEYRFD